MNHPRRDARILAMQALCQWEAQCDASSAAMRDFLAWDGASPKTGAYAAKMVEAFWADTEGVDMRITAALEKWELSRLSSIERNVMRVAVVELLGGEVPDKVVLNEAIDIARDFGGADSPGFVNGVLDEILKRIKEGGS